MGDAWTKPKTLLGSSRPRGIIFQLKGRAGVAGTPLGSRNLPCFLHQGFTGLVPQGCSVAKPEDARPGAPTQSINRSKFDARGTTVIFLSLCSPWEVSSPLHPRMIARMDNYTSLIDALIKSEMDGHPRHEMVLDLGPTPEFLLLHAAFPALNLVLKGSVVGKACFDHGIATSILKRLPEIIATPKSLYRPANSGLIDSVVVMTLETKGGCPIIVPIRKQQRIGRTGVFNTVTSIYAKEGPDPEKKWRRDGLLIKDL